jgi:predicted nucleic acid binding AN1-type Zn finger protein
MASVQTLDCAVKGGLFRCREAAAGVCVYCGRPFCARHGVFLAEGEQVCARKFCVAKRRDLDRHLVYKQDVLNLNRQRQCGITGCGASFSDQCSRCKGYFCGRHLDARDDPVMENGVKVPRMASMCSHCWRRRPIWTRI